MPPCTIMHGGMRVQLMVMGPTWWMSKCGGPTGPIVHGEVHGLHECTLTYAETCTKFSRSTAVCTPYCSVHIRLYVALDNTLDLQL